VHATCETAQQRSRTSVSRPVGWLSTLITKRICHCCWPLASYACWQNTTVPRHYAPKAAASFSRLAKCTALAEKNHRIITASRKKPPAFSAVANCSD